MNESLLYPVIHRPEKKEIYIPDFDKTVHYEDPDIDIIEISQEAIGELLKACPDKLPCRNFIEKNLIKTGVLIYIHIWPPYHVNKTEKVKKHITIPNSVNIDAIQYNINFSQKLSEELENIILNK